MSTQYTTYVPYTGWQPGSGILLPAAPMGALVTPPEGTWLTPKAKDSVVTLKLCEGCRRTYASGADWHLYPGDYLAAFRAAGSVPVALCDACASKPFQAEPEETIADRKAVVEILQEIRSERARINPAKQYKRNPVSEQHARRHYIKWRIDLLAALKIRTELSTQELRDITHLRHPRIASYIRRTGINLVKSRRVGDWHTETTVFYKLGAVGETLLPPQDSETKQFMKEVKPTEFSDEFIARKFKEFRKAQAKLGKEREDA